MLGHRVLTLGQDDNGPLIYLALTREYRAAVRPRHVVWMFYEGNDVDNLNHERRIPQLLLYLERGHRQNLIDRQTEVDSLLTDLITRYRREQTQVDSTSIATDEAGTAGTSLESMARRFGRLVGDVLFLRHLRGRIAMALYRPRSAVALDEALLRRIFERAEADVGSWGGEFHVALLPAWERFGAPRAASPHLQPVRRLLDEIGIPVIDVLPAFEQTEEPLDLFPFSLKGRYTAQGYSLVAKAISAAIE